MSFLLARPYKLSRSTVQAWQQAGGIVLSADRTNSEIARAAEGAGVEFVINLGRSWFNLYGDVPMFNQGDNIKPLVTPGGTRDILDPYLPPQDVGEVWVKTPGRAGVGKYQVSTDVPLVLPSEWDWQSHVEGQEYRIITVGHRIVQNFQRFGDNGEREYHWIAMREMDASLKELVRTAARTVRGDNVIAWDVISTPAGQHYIFEGNTCPGMSVNTANRIATEARRLLRERG